ncbi:hypothetical protein DFJ74DRAFT_201612 [Hyaloraphidium curvatum]|nr:hypothetical protein DFJ74DRAFT_201612 [Hyaloraphidium curvatum]
MPGSPGPSVDRVVVIRCGGAQAACTWEAVSTNYEAERRAGKVAIWDDADHEPHVTLRDLVRLRDAAQAARFAAGKTVDCFVCVGNPLTREKLACAVRKELQGTFVRFPAVVHPAAFVSPTATVKEGTYVGPFALVHTNATVGSFCIVNSHATVEHDCVLEDFCQLNPHATVGGCARIGRYSVLGLGSSVRDKATIAPRSLIGMQAAVVRNIAEVGRTWIGVPAKQLLPPPVATGKPGPGVLRGLRWCGIKPLSFESMKRYLEESLRLNQLTNGGPLQTVLGQKLASITGSSRAIIPCANGTAALHALAAAWSLKLGKPIRWATQAFTFPPAIQGSLSGSLVLDNDLELGGPCMASLERFKDAIDGVVVTNVFGLQTRILEYEAWCNRHGKVLIFDDAATPVGFLPDGRSILDAGNGSIISLHETKPLGRGEGGAVFVDAEIAPFVSRVINFGFDTAAVVRVGLPLASNWRMSDIAAAAICDHLDTILNPAWMSHHQALVRKVPGLLRARGLDFDTCFSIQGPTILPCLLIRVPDPLIGRVDELCRWLYSQDREMPVEAKHYYVPLADRQAVPNAWAVFDRNICIPFHSDLSLSDIECAMDSVLAGMRANMPQVGRARPASVEGAVHVQ